MSRDPRPPRGRDRARRQNHRPGAGEPRTVLVGSAALTTAVLPYFLVGALTVSLQRDLGISASAIGALGTVLFLVASSAATPAGWLVDRFGAGAGLRTGVTLAGLIAIAVAGLAGRWWHLAVAMALVGGCVALVDTGAARAFADRVRPDRQGTAFGVKEASIPAATMVAGLAVPTVGARLGWQAAYVGAALVALVVLLSIPRRAALRSHGPPAQRPDVAEVAKTTLIRFTVGVALGAGAAMGAAFFLVGAFVDRGLVEQRAALVLSAASIASIVVRVAVGMLADRPDVHPVEVMGGLLAVGGAAALVLALPVATPVAAIAAVVLLAGAWGWTGLAFLAVVRGNPAAPGAAAGVVLTGLSMGGALGPLGFGVLADQVSYAASWLVAGLVLVAAALIVLSARAVERDRGGNRPR